MGDFCLSVLSFFFQNCLSVGVVYMALRRLFYSFGAVEENALSPRVESIFLQHNLLMI